MSLKCELSYNKFTDHVIGYTDKAQLATHAAWVAHEVEASDCLLSVSQHC